MGVLADVSGSVTYYIFSVGIWGKGIMNDVRNGGGEPQTESEDVSEVTSDEVATGEEPGSRNGHHYDPAEGSEDGHQGECGEHDRVQSPRLSVRSSSRCVSAASQVRQEDLPPAVIKPIPVGDHKVRSQLRFEVVTARVVEVAGKKHVAYTIMMKRAGPAGETAAQGSCPAAVIERRYNDFCFIYECILKSFHPSILGDFLFPKKVLIGNFKAEVISERTEAFHKFLNLISSCDSLLYSDYFYSFLTSEEHNEAVSHIKLGKYGEAVPLLETIFYIREKLLTASNIMVLLVLCELVSCLAAIERTEEAFAYTQVLVQCFELNRGHPEAESLRVAYLKMASQLAGSLGHDKKPFDRQLSEMRYAGLRIDTTPTMLEIIRDRYIHRASHTSKLS